MPGKYEIDINVRDKSAGAGGGSYAQAGGRGNVPSREQMAEMRDRRQQVQQAQRGTTASTNLEKAMMSLVKEQQKLTSEIRNLSAVMRATRGGGGGGGTPRPGGGGLGGSIGGGVGTIGAGLGFGIGAVLGIVGYAVKKVMDIGEAYIAKASQQVTTEGVGGFQGGMGPWLAAESGQFYKAARMQGGRFGEKVINEKAIGNFAHLFGLGGQEMGQMIGTFGRSQGPPRTVNGKVVGGLGGGEEAFSRAVLTARKGGIETDLLPMMQGITSALEDAVKEGVNASNLATDMAKELATAQNLKSPPIGVKALMATQQSIMGLQGQVAGGQFGTPAGFTMFRAGSSMWKNDQDFMLRARASGLLTNEMIEGARKGERLDPNIERAVTQMYLEEKPLSARMEYGQQVLKQFGGVTDEELRSGDISPAKRAQVMSLAQTYGFQGFETPAKSSKLIDLALGIGRSATGGPGGNFINPGNTSTDLMSTEISGLAAGKTGLGAVGYEQTKEGALLGMGEPFAASAVNLQRSMLGSAKAMSDLATTALPALDAGVSALSKGLTATITTITESIKKIQEEGIGAFVGDAVKGAFAGSFNPFSK